MHYNYIYGLTAVVPFASGANYRKGQNIAIRYPNTYKTVDGSSVSPMANTFSRGYILKRALSENIVMQTTRENVAPQVLNFVKENLVTTAQSGVAGGNLPNIQTPNLTNNNAQILTRQFSLNWPIESLLTEGYNQFPHPVENVVPYLRLAGVPLKENFGGTYDLLFAKSDKTNVSWVSHIDTSNGKRIPQKADSGYNIWTTSIFNAGNQESYAILCDTIKKVATILVIEGFSEIPYRFAGNVGQFDFWGNIHHHRVDLSDFSQVDLSNDAPPIVDALMSVWLNDQDIVYYTESEKDKLTIYGNKDLMIWYDDRKYKKIVLNDIKLTGRTVMQSATVSNKLSANHITTSNLTLQGADMSATLRIV
jgi:hypothetical protein